MKERCGVYVLDQNEDRRLEPKQVGVYTGRIVELDYAKFRLWNGK